jgi:hypothetical protein
MPKSQIESASPLGKIAGIVGLLAIALLFTGWIYRWHYFTYFQVDPTSLGLPVESMSMAAFSLLFRSPGAMARFLIGLALACAGMVASFRAIHFGLQRLNPLLQQLQEQIGLVDNQRQQLRLLASLLDELVIVLWLLLLLYGLAASQGLADARRDATDETSTLPLITVAMAGREAVIGRDPNQLLADPSGVRLFGNRERYDALLRADLNPNSGDRHWRLLSDAGGRLLVIPSLPGSQMDGKAPVVLIFADGGKGDRIVILSPAQSR